MTLYAFLHTLYTIERKTGNFLSINENITRVEKAMKTIQRRFFTSVLVVIAFVFFLFGDAVSQTSFSGQVSRVLILLSYHNTHSWTAGILDGVKDELAQADMNFELHVEFMDTKRHNPDDVFPQLEELYRTKYKNIQFDLIILSDNNALNFLLLRRTLLFPPLPH